MGEWLWLRTNNGYNLAPAHSCCTYFCRSKVQQIGIQTQKTLSHILMANMRNALVIVVP